MAKCGFGFANRVIPLPQHWNNDAIIDRLSEGPHALYIEKGDHMIWKNFPSYKKTAVPVEERFAKFYEEIADVVHEYLKEFDPGELVLNVFCMNDFLTRSCS